MDGDETKPRRGAWSLRGRAARGSIALLAAVGLLPLMGVAAAEEVALVDQPPVATFTWSCVQTRICTFDATGSYDPEGQQLAFVWYFGDGWADVGPVVTHEYAKNFRRYDIVVVLHAVDATGNLGEAIQAISLKGGK